MECHGEGIVSADEGSEATGGLRSRNAALVELALRLVPEQFGPSGAPREPPRLWPGQIPELPFELPVPENARVIGSYGRGQQVSVLVDTDMTPKEFGAFYSGRMLAAGWITPAWQQGPGGFVQPEMAQRAHALFCRGVEGPALTVVAETGSDHITHGTLTIHLDPTDNPCRPPVPHTQEHFMRFGPHIPGLESPPDSSLVSHGMSSNPEMSSALATLTTSLDLSAVLEHYGRQLAEAGWESGEAAESGSVAWSTWSFADRDRSAAHGILFVIREPGETGSYALFLHALGHGDDPPNGGE
jgi:hypothetical protein